MKIVVIIEEQFAGGFQKVAINQVIALKKLGISCELIILRKSSKKGFSDILAKNNIAPIYLDNSIPSFLKFSFKFAFFNYFSLYHITYPILLYFFTKKLDFDLMIVHGTYTSLSAIPLSKKFGIRCINFMHDPIKYVLSTKYKNKFLDKIKSITIPLARLVDELIIKNSLFVLAYPRFSYLKQYKNVKFINNGCDVITTPVKLKKDFAVAFTKWDKSKNIEFLINLWQQNNFNLELQIIGTFADFRYQKKVETLIKTKNLQDKIKILGAITESELINKLSNAKLLVSVNEEAFGMTILESSACFCPSVFVRTSGVSTLYPSEILKNQPSLNNYNEFAKEISRIINMDNKKYLNYTNIFYETSKNNNWQNHCNQILQFLNEQ